MDEFYYFWFNSRKNKFFRYLAYSGEIGKNMYQYLIFFLFSAFRPTDYFSASYWFFIFFWKIFPERHFSMQNFRRRNFCKHSSWCCWFRKGAPREAFHNSELDPTELLTKFLLVRLVSNGAPREAFLDAELDAMELLSKFFVALLISKRAPREEFLDAELYPTKLLGIF